MKQQTIKFNFVIAGSGLHPIEYEFKFRRQPAHIRLHVRTRTKSEDLLKLRDPIFHKRVLRDLAEQLATSIRNGQIEQKIETNG